MPLHILLQFLDHLKLLGVDSAKADLFVQQTGSRSAGKAAGEADAVPGVTCL